MQSIPSTTKSIRKIKKIIKKIKLPWPECQIFVRLAQLQKRALVDFLKRNDFFHTAILYKLKWSGRIIITIIPVYLESDERWPPFNVQGKDSISKYVAKWEFLHWVTLMQPFNNLATTTELARVENVNFIPQAQKFVLFTKPLTVDGRNVFLYTMVMMPTFQSAWFIDFNRTSSSTMFRQGTLR